jgi:hypothetical protein
LLQLTAYVAVIVAYLQGGLSTLALPFLLLIVLLNPVTPFVAANGFGRNSYFNAILAAALVLTAFFPTPWIPVASLALVSALTYVLHRLGWTRAPFNDLKNKQNLKCRDFFRRYCAAFKKVFSERMSLAARPAPSPQPHAAGRQPQEA